MARESVATRVALTPWLTAEEFDRHYFYAAELRKFARDLGLKQAPTRKIELEGTVRAVLNGDAPVAAAARRTGPRDTLAPGTHVVRYVDDASTKAWLLEQVRASVPTLKTKSGQWYWLNDWRRSRLAAGDNFTYGELADRLAALMATAGRLPQIPSARFNNFVTDYLADPSNPIGTKADAVAAWEETKATPGPKTYAAFRDGRLSP